jgi:hypothetical protein
MFNGMPMPSQVKMHKKSVNSSMHKAFHKPYWEEYGGAPPWKGLQQSTTEECQLVKDLSNIILAL